MPVVKCKHTKLMPTSELIPFPRNPNQHSEAQIARLAEIIEYQGWRRPIRVSLRSGYITAGHGALSAAKLKGWDTVPVDLQEYDNEEQEYADVVADNSLHEWNDCGISLQAVNEEVPKLGPEFDIKLLGIEEFEIDVADKYGNKDDDSIPEKVDPICKLGDLWQLGAHRLLCGDATKKEDVELLMNGEKADMVFTDPPYNHAQKDELIASPVRQAMQQLKDSKWDKDFNFSSVLPIIDDLVSENCSIYICTSWHLAGEIWGFYSTHSSHSSYCVWAKPNPMPSLSKRHWTWSSELICYATKGKHVFNFPIDGHAKNIWEIQKNQKNDLHPTQKPVAVPEHAIEHSSNIGMLVFDGFLGSGTTLIACEKTGRRCYGTEIDPCYVDVIIKRYEDYTDKKAEKINAR